MERNTTSEKRPYETPKLIVHGDLETITLGTDVGEDLDGAFMTASHNPKGRKKPKRNFS